VEGVESAFSGVTYVNRIAMKVFGHDRIFAFGVQNKDFCVVGGKVRQDAFGTERFT